MAVHGQLPSRFRSHLVGEIYVETEGYSLVEIGKSPRIDSSQCCASWPQGIRAAELRNLIEKYIEQWRGAVRESTRLAAVSRAPYTDICGGLAFTIVAFKARGRVEDVGATYVENQQWLRVNGEV